MYSFLLDFRFLFNNSVIECKYTKHKGAEQNVTSHNTPYWPLHYR